MSMNSRSLPPASADEKRRQQACRDAGCEACHQLRLPKDQHCGIRFEYHHPKEGNLRISERTGYALGPWHHQGTIRGGYSLERMLEVFGPNLRDDARGFHAMFGTDQALQNGQDDRIGWPREQIPSRRELRLRGESNPRKPSKCTPSIKTVPRNGWPT